MPIVYNHIVAEIEGRFEAVALLSADAAVTAVTPTFKVGGEEVVKDASSFDAFVDLTGGFEGTGRLTVDAQPVVVVPTVTPSAEEVITDASSFGAFVDVSGGFDAVGRVGADASVSVVVPAFTPAAQEVITDASSFDARVDVVGPFNGVGRLAADASVSVFVPTFAASGQEVITDASSFDARVDVVGPFNGVGRLAANASPVVVTPTFTATGSEVIKDASSFDARVDVFGAFSGVGRPTADASVSVFVPQAVASGQEVITDASSFDAFVEVLSSFEAIAHPAADATVSVFVPTFTVSGQEAVKDASSFDAFVEVLAPFEGTARPSADATVSVFTPTFTASGQEVIKDASSFDAFVDVVSSFNGVGRPTTNASVSVVTPTFTASGQEVIQDVSSFGAFVQTLAGFGGTGRVSAEASVSATTPAVTVSGTEVIKDTSTYDARSEHVLSDLTRDARWDTVGTQETDLTHAQAASARIKADVRPGDQGVLMEQGAGGDGLAVVIENGGTDGEERLLAMAGDGGDTTGTDTAVVEHQVNYRFQADVDLDTFTLPGDHRAKIAPGFFVDAVSGSYDSYVTSVSYDSAADETTVVAEENSGVTLTDVSVAFGPETIIAAFSADVGAGQVILYENGAPVDSDTIDNAELCGGNEGGIGDNYAGTRELGLGWSGSDYAYDNTVYWADVYAGKTTDLVQSYPTDELTLDNTHTEVGASNSYIASGSKQASARVFVNIDDQMRNGEDVGIVMEDGGQGDGLVMYGHNGTLYFQAGDGSVQGGSTEVSWPIEKGPHVIEWTADVTNSRTELWVDGSKVDEDTGWSAPDDLAGGNPGGIGRAKSIVPVNRAGYSEGGGAFRFEVVKAEIFSDEVFAQPMSFGSTSYTYDTSAGTASHSADWSGGVRDFTFEIFETSSESNLIYSQSAISDRQDSDNGYSSPSFQFGDTVWFKVTDAQGETLTTSVSVSTTS